MRTKEGRPVRTRSRALGVAAAVLTVAGSVLVGSPASAATGGTGYSSCVKTSTTNTYSTYATADNQSSRVSATSTRVVLDVYGTGRTFDCGPGGRPQTVPSLKVQTTYVVEGSDINCTIGGGTDGNVTFSCTPSKTSATITDTYTCSNVSYCQMSDIGVVFTAAGSGRIDKIDTTVKVTISGPSGQSSATSYVTAFKR